MRFAPPDGQTVMLDQHLKTQLQGYLARLTAPVELVASLATSATSENAPHAASRLNRVRSKRAMAYTK